MDCWSDAIFDVRPSGPGPGSPFLVGVLMGEGIGPEVMGCALNVLKAVELACGHRFEVRTGGPIGREAEQKHGAALSPEVIDFCGNVFSHGGAILAGPGGGRFVYDLRKQFGLFCKLSPLKVAGELRNAGRIKPEYVRSVDILVVRENLGGIYQGQWQEVSAAGADRRAEHSFSYGAGEVRRILQVGAAIARQRRGEIAVVTKEAGVPAISKLWRDCTVEIAASTGVSYTLLDIDYAAFRLLQDARDIDVVVAPNLFGDVLSDLGAVLLGSRGLAYSGNFAATGAAVYQTNHGAAFDLAGTNRANPVGQILALAMLLRESFGMVPEAQLIDQAVARVWREGWRTFDLAEEGFRLVGTREMGDLCAEAVAAQSPRRPIAPSSGKSEGVKLPSTIIDGKPASHPGLRVLSHRSPLRPETDFWSVPVCGEEQVAAATAAAGRAWPSWRQSEPAERAGLLERLAERLEEGAGDLSKRLAEEIGKPLVYGRGEVRGTAALLRAVARRAGTERGLASGTGTNFRHRSVGVIALITPWNNPLFIPLGKIAPALLYGNTVVWKPAPAGASLAVRVLEDLAAVGCPPGILNLICGDRSAGELLMADAQVDAVTVTGSAPAGFSAQEICARRFIPLQAELGGNNAAIVWSDCDLQEAARLIAEGAFGQAGQRCTANRRVIVEEGCSRELLLHLERAAASLTWGDPREENTRIGPLLSAERAGQVGAVVGRAEAAHKVVVPHKTGPRIGNLLCPDAYYPPTIVCCDDPRHEIVQEETFGPVLVVQSAADWTQAIGLCNGVRQGLVAAIFSQSQDLQGRFLAEAEAGILKINRATADAEVDFPFGGWKASGIGPPEHGDSDREFYTRTQTIYR